MRCVLPHEAHLMEKMAAMEFLLVAQLAESTVAKNSKSGGAAPSINSPRFSGKRRNAGISSPVKRFEF